MEKRLWLLAAATFLPAIVPVWAASPATFDIEVHGNFKRMAHTGDTSGKIKLDALDARPDLYGVGALAGLRGEILIWNGRVLVTRGHSRHGAVESARPDDEAVLLVTSKVSGWSEVRVPVDMDQKLFEAFIVESAKKHGLSPADPFPFAVRGEFPRVKWHVVTGFPRAKDGNAAGAKHAQGHARSRVFEQAHTRGVILGFYSGDSLEGVITHPGERFHLHNADPDFRTSGHTDEYTVARGAVLLLPR
jgi:alpha-acetolactate decarboxylase